MITEALEKMDRQMAASLASQRAAMVRDGLPAADIECFLARAIAVWADERPRVEAKMREILTRQKRRAAVH